MVIIDYILVLYVLNTCFSKSLEITCEEAVSLFPAFRCLTPADPGYVSEAKKHKLIFSLKDKLNGKKHLLTVKRTSSLKVEDNPEIFFLNLAQRKRSVVGMEDYKIKEDYTYLITEKPEHYTLASFIKKNKYLNDNVNVLRMFSKLLSAASYMHFRGIVHAGLSPESIMVDEGFNPLIANFDNAEEFDSNHLKNLRREYNDPYITDAPADRIIRFDDKTDIWSLGVILYFMVHKSYPTVFGQFHGPADRKKTLMIVDKGVPLEFSQILDKCLKLRPSQRDFLFDIRIAVHDIIAGAKLTPSSTDIPISLEHSLPSKAFTVFEKFAELIFVLFLVLLIIPLSVYLISRRVKADENEVLENARQNNNMQ